VIRRRAPSLGFTLAHLVGVSMLWASGFVFVKALNPVQGPFGISAWRAGIACLALGAFIALRGGSLMPRRGELRHWIVLGAIQGFIPNVLTALGLRTVTAGTASMIQASGPLVVALLAHWIFHEERLTPRRILGLVVGFCGVAGLAAPAIQGDGTGDAAGIALMMGVTLAYSIAALYVANIDGGDPLRLTSASRLSRRYPRSR
jgi:drug/metabolite transporter (DMT)-like permease